MQWINIRLISEINLASIHDLRCIQITDFKNNALIPSSPLLLTAAAETKYPETLDTEKAKALLENAGWKIDPQTGNRVKKNVTLEFTIATNDSLVNSKAAELLANQWRSLNIKVNLTVLPSKQLSDTLIKPRTFDVLLFPQKFGADPDPFLFWHSSQAKDPGFNLTGFQDAAADKLITEARTTTDRKTREEKYQHFNDIIVARIPVIFWDQTMSGMKNFTTPQCAFTILPTGIFRKTECGNETIEDFWYKI